MLKGPLPRRGEEMLESEEFNPQLATMAVRDFEADFPDVSRIPEMIEKRVL